MILIYQADYFLQQAASLKAELLSYSNTGGFISYVR